MSAEKDSLGVFISSTMDDLREERLCVKEVLEDLQLKPLLAETMGSHTGPPRDVILGKVQQSDIYIGIFWQRYGKTTSQWSATEEEYREAHSRAKPILIYIKEPSPQREDLLKRFLLELERYQEGHIRTKFTSLDELRRQVRQDVMREVCRLANENRTKGTTATSLATLEMAQKPDTLHSEGEGVRQYLRERIDSRLAQELDPSVQRYKTMDAVERASYELAKKIREDNFCPDVILAWTEVDAGRYRGSQTVANLIAAVLDAPVRVLKMKEVGESREVIEDCDWIREYHNVLVVDDACYSGSTLRGIQKKLSDVDAAIELRFAVLTTVDQTILPSLYSVSQHSTEELLFPWGWSRLIKRFYDIYKIFGISDRRTVLHEHTAWGSISTFTPEHISSLRLITVETAQEMRQGDDRPHDAFLYFLSGSAELQIGDRKGNFVSGEYIFIPRGIGFAVRACDSLQILELNSRME